MTTHRRSRMLAAIAVDERLTPAARDELDAHLRSCLACRATAGALRIDAGVLRDRPRIPPSLGMRARVFAATGPRAPDARVTDLRLLVVAALLVAGLGVFSLTAGRPAPDDVAPLDPPQGISVPGIGPATTLALPAGSRASGPCIQLVETGCATATLVAFGSVWTTTTDAVVRVDDAGTTVAEVVTQGVPVALASDGISLWAATRAPNAVIRIDVTDAEVAATYPVGGLPAGLAVLDGRVWVGDEQAGVLVLDAADGSIKRQITLDGGVWSMAATSDAVWAADRTMTTLTRIDPASGRASAVPLQLPTPENLWDYGGGVVAAGGRIWLASGHEVDRYDPETGATVSVLASTFPHLAVDGTTVWIVGGLGQTTIRMLDAGTLRSIAENRLPLLAQNRGGEWELSVAVTPDAVWIRSAGDGRLVRVAREGGSAPPS